MHAHTHKLDSNEFRAAVGIAGLSDDTSAGSTHTRAALPKNAPPFVPPNTSQLTELVSNCPIA